MLEYSRIAGTLLAALIISSCEEYPTPYQPGLYPRAAPAGLWNDEGASGKPRIIVHIGEQKAYFYKGKTLVGETTVSTGKPGFSTPPGHYTVISKRCGSRLEPCSAIMWMNTEMSLGQTSTHERTPSERIPFRWRANAVCHVLQRRLRDASGLRPALCRVAWLHPFAGTNGRQVFRKRSCRNFGDGNGIADV